MSSSRTRELGQNSILIRMRELEEEEEEEEEEEGEEGEEREEGEEKSVGSEVHVR